MRQMIRAIIFGLACMLFSAHAAFAAAQPCSGQMKIDCAVQAEADAASKSSDDGAVEPAASPQDHASQCHDQCKGSGQSLVLSFSLDVQRHESFSPLVLAQLTAGTLIRPPR